MILSLMWNCVEINSECIYAQIKAKPSMCTLKDLFQSGLSGEHRMLFLLRS